MNCYSCQEPIEMRGYTMKHLHDIHRTMRCVDKYGHRPEKDGAILLGTLIGKSHFFHLPFNGTHIFNNQKKRHESETPAGDEGLSSGTLILGRKEGCQPKKARLKWDWAGAAAYTMTTGKSLHTIDAGGCREKRWRDDLDV